MHDNYLDPNIIVELHKKFESDRINSILNKYWENDSAIEKIMNQITPLREMNKTFFEKSIAGRVKQRRKKAEILKKRVKLKEEENRNRKQNLN